MAGRLPALHAGSPPLPGIVRMEPDAPPGGARRASATPWRQ